MSQLSCPGYRTRNRRENGAGKSTLMKILSGVYTKDAGTVVFDGETIEYTTPIESLNRGLSIIYQEFNLVNTMSVGENIFLGRFSEMHGMRGTHAEARKLLDSIGCSIDTRKLLETSPLRKSRWWRSPKRCRFKAS